MNIRTIISFFAVGIAFLLELLVFFMFALIAFSLNIQNSTVKGVLFFVLLIAILSFWGVYMAPKSKIRFVGLKYYAAKAIIYSIAAYSMYASINATWAIGFVAIAIVDELLMYMFPDKDHMFTKKPE